MKAPGYGQVLAVLFTVISTAVSSHSAISSEEEYPLEVATQATVLTPISEDSAEAFEQEPGEDSGSEDQNSSSGR